MIAIFTECHTHYLEHKARILDPWTWVIIYKAGIDEHVHMHAHTHGRVRNHAKDLNVLQSYIIWLMEEQARGLH